MIVHAFSRPPGVVNRYGHQRSIEEHYRWSEFAARFAGHNRMGEKIEGQIAGIDVKASVWVKLRLQYYRVRKGRPAGRKPRA